MAAAGFFAGEALRSFRRDADALGQPRTERGAVVVPQRPGIGAQEVGAEEAEGRAAYNESKMIEEGHKQYMNNCRPCHGSKGTAGVPLAGNPKVADNPGYLIWAILTGPGYMPEFAPALSNEQIAAIATFVENSWGNSSGMVSPDDVQMSR